MTKITVPILVLLSAFPLISNAVLAQQESGANIYALFFCFNESYCQIHGRAHIGPGGANQEVPYDTLAECQQAARRNSGGRSPDKDGRTIMDNGSWYECRSKHVDTWNPTQ